MAGALDEQGGGSVGYRATGWVGGSVALDTGRRLEVGWRRRRRRKQDGEKGEEIAEEEIDR